MTLQGFAFLAQYRTLRGGDERDVDEVDFNFGRAFQQLGLHSYAVMHYEKVLRAAEERLGLGSNVRFSWSLECSEHLSIY
jgi:general transcription factor 3C polypeptide 3 (transcription factor C subunit 4)